MLFCFQPPQIPPRVTPVQVILGADATYSDFLEWSKEEKRRLESESRKFYQLQKEQPPCTSKKKSISETK